MQKPRKERKPVWLEVERGAAGGDGGDATGLVPLESVDGQKEAPVGLSPRCGARSLRRDEQAAFEEPVAA